MTIEKMTLCYQDATAVARIAEIKKIIRSEAATRTKIMIVAPKVIFILGTGLETIIQFVPCSVPFRFTVKVITSIGLAAETISDSIDDGNIKVVEVISKISYSILFSMEEHIISFFKASKNVESAYDKIKAVLLILSNQEKITLGVKNLVSVIHKGPRGDLLPFEKTRYIDKKYFEDGLIMVTDISELDEIPDDMRYLECYEDKNLCPISNNPIRYAVGAVGEEIHPESPIYEKSNLLQFLNGHEDELPPNWPAQVIFNRTNIVPFLSKQNEIDRNLREYVKDFKLLHKDPLLDDYVFAFVDKFYFFDLEVSDLKINAIVRSFLPKDFLSKIYSVYVRKIEHKFKYEVGKISAIEIQIDLMIPLICARHENLNVEYIAGAVLGNHDYKYQNELRKFLQVGYSKMLIVLSPDRYSFSAIS
ncbi:MAG: hypothetical protein A3F40_01490 [Chlamydiae bacterium RIFCSPHIGHO2_12_FULL_27_8]|nr:MAG: hypothetical protein A3F40_01490 [Chlamydiae bacterium RIFCSPHIGHO2_12_FULL_27_8]OGN64946.1 MAG: hypothetical protein A2888_01880 [Chlamydiae bacterium RIFCSPLOWO2_01_FULL_28_7]